MQAYPKYKEPSLPDLSFIPAHWEEKRMKLSFTEIDECSATGDEEMLSVSHITGITPRSQKNVNMFVTESNVGLKICSPGDIVINTMWAWMAALGVSKYHGIVSPSYGVYRPKGQNYNQDYLDFLLRTEIYRAEYVRRSTGINTSRLRLYPDRFLDMRFICPPREEQDQIVRFLDWKVSQINRLINNKKKQVALLQEGKQAIINRAFIQRGVSWESRPLKYWVESNLKSLSSNTSHDYEIDYLDISSVGHGFVKNEPVHFSFNEAPSRARRIVCYGDTIISTVRTYLRSVCFISHEYEHCTVSTGFSVLTPNKKIVLPELLSFVLTSDQFVDNVIRNSIGVSYPAINDSKLMSLKIALPLSLEEQADLHLTIKKQFGLFDELISALRQQLAAISEYRTRLISDVVTGKMDVRNIVVPEYEKVEDMNGYEELDGETMYEDQKGENK
jgi:type I restriction enzyme S subunit